MNRRALLAVVCVAALDVLPVALVLKQALTPEAESLAWPPTWIPREWTLENFRALGAGGELVRGLWLSLGVAGMTVLLAIGLALPAAWVAVRDERIGDGLDGALVLARAFPSIAIAVPLASLFVGLGLYNDPRGVGLWLVHALLALPVAFLILRNGVRDLPAQVLEAAELDGAGGVSLLWHVVLPLLRPSLGAAALLVFLLSWDEFTYSLLLQVTNRPLPPLLYYLSSFGYPGLASAVAAVMLVPAIAIVVVVEPALRSGAFAGSER